VLGSAATTLAATGTLPRGESTAAAPPAKAGLRFGIHTLPHHTTWTDIAAVWEEADGLGLDSAFVFDHFMPIQGDQKGPCLEGWTLLAALAARTKRLRVGVLVTGNTYRWPALLAKMAATVDHVSGGRLILGMGAGWFEREHQAYGIPFHTPGGRARRLVESVEVVKKLFTQESTTYAGKYYQLKDAPFMPRAVQRPHPPILIGGMGPKVIQPLAARHAQIWHFFASDPRRVQQLCTGFDDLCRAAGRDPPRSRSPPPSVPATSPTSMRRPSWPACRSWRMRASATSFWASGRRSNATSCGGSRRRSRHRCDRASEGPTRSAAHAGYQVGASPARSGAATPDRDRGLGPGPALGDSDPADERQRGEFRGLPTNRRPSVVAGVRGGPSSIASGLPCARLRLSFSRSVVRFTRSSRAASFLLPPERRSACAMIRSSMASISR
jgi:F420-dependent oxidoreductase-like protein